MGMLPSPSEHGVQGLFEIDVHPVEKANFSLPQESRYGVFDRRNTTISQDAYGHRTRSTYSCMTVNQNTPFSTRQYFQDEFDRGQHVCGHDAIVVVIGGVVHRNAQILRFVGEIERQRLGAVHDTYDVVFVEKI